MASTVDTLDSSAATPARGLRFALFTRAAVLLAVGLVVTFTAASHSDVAFDITMLAVSFLLIGLATGVEYLALRGAAESWWVAARAVIAFGAFGAMLVVSDALSMALILATWAVLTALTTLMRVVRHVQPAKVAVPSLLLSLALAGAVLFAPNDEVAAIGFFGAYAIIRGVFLGIAAFDSGAARAGAASESIPSPTPETESI